MKSRIIVAAIVVFAVLGCSKVSEKELFEKAVEAKKGGQFDEALEQYQLFLTEYPKSPKVPEALYAMGSIYQSNRHEFNKAIEAYKRIVRDYPDHATTSSASFLVGFIYNNELKNVDSARMAYRDFLAKYPNSPMASSAKFELDNLGKDPEEFIRPKIQAEKSKNPKKTKGR